MIIMINGAFGSGKTTTANKLLPLIPNSMMFDPEEIGYMLRNIIPEAIRLDVERTDDFQDIELWRVLTVQTAEALQHQYYKHLIVPMTIYKPHIFEYIVHGFQRMDNQVHHFCLMASEDTIHKRLTGRGDEANGWTFQQTVKCVEAFKNARFEEHIITDEMTSDEVVSTILLRTLPQIEE